VLLPLSGLSQLTKVVVGPVRDRSSLQHLPAQLRHLVCSVEPFFAEDSWQLRHLTAVTTLDIGESWSACLH